jgi:hypothetical protein
MNRQGYVLMMVIVVLLILTAALTTLASRSLRATQQASNAAALLQQRWGIYSAKTETLQFASTIIQKVEDKMRLEGGGRITKPNGVFAESVELGGQRFDLVLSDENSKLNLNTVYHMGGPAKVTKAMRDLMGASVTRYMNPKPAVMSAARGATRRPAVSDSDTIVSDPSLDLSAGSDDSDSTAFRSWGELFDFAKIASESDIGDVKLDFTRSLTLWGKGNLNINRTSDEILLAQMELVLGGKAKDLLSNIRASNTPDIPAILETMEGINILEKQRLRKLIGTSSFDFSLFIDVDAPQGRSRRLFMSASDANGSPQISEFVFH